MCVIKHCLQVVRPSCLPLSACTRSGCHGTEESWSDDVDGVVFAQTCFSSSHYHTIALQRVIVKGGSVCLVVKEKKKHLHG